MGFLLAWLVTSSPSAEENRCFLLHTTTLCVVQVQLILMEARRGAQRNGVSEAPPSLQVKEVAIVLSNIGTLQV